MTGRKENRDDESRKAQTAIPWWQPSVILFTRLSGWIGVPVIAALFVGKWLDERYDSEPWLFLACVGLAFFVSSVGIVKEATVAMKKFADEPKKSSTAADKTDKNDPKLK